MPQDVVLDNGRLIDDKGNVVPASALAGASGDSITVAEIDFSTVVLDAFVPVVAVAADDLLSIIVFSPLAWDQNAQIRFGYAGNPSITGGLSLNGPEPDATMANEDSDVILRAKAATMLGYKVSAVDVPTTGHSVVYFKVESP
jgi:hypothetical protein